MKKLNRNPTEEEYSSAWSKILWYTDSSQRFAKEIYIIIDSFDNVQDKLSLAASLLYVVFFSKDQLERSMNFSTLLICILIAHSMEIFCKVL